MSSFLNIRIIGDAGVGKSCLVLRFSEGSYTESFISSINGLHGDQWEITKAPLHGETVTLRVIDKFPSSRKEREIHNSDNYLACNAYIVAFDLTDMDSFNSVSQYLEGIRRYARDPHIVLACCKADQRAIRAVEHDEIKAYCEKESLSFYEVSAKTGAGVAELFTALAGQCIPPKPPSVETLRGRALIDEITRHIGTLETEVRRLFAGKKSLKLLKRTLLITLRDELSRENVTTVREKIHAYRTAHPILDQGMLSHRTRDIFNRYDPEGPVSK
jgi:Ras-related protein Rab-1A